MPEGLMQFRPARDLVRADTTPEFVHLEGGLYKTIAVAVVGPNEVRIIGQRDVKGWRRRPRTSMVVAMSEIIPVILNEGETDE